MNLPVVELPTIPDLKNRLEGAASAVGQVQKDMDGVRETGEFTKFWLMIVIPVLGVFLFSFLVIGIWALVLYHKKYRRQMK